MGSVSFMATRRIELGPIGETVAANVARYRQRAGLSMRQVAAEVTSLGRPLSASGVSHIENLNRRVDADDLVYLASVVEATPNQLLMPLAASGDEMLKFGPLGEATAARVWEWLRLNPPADDAITRWYPAARGAGLAPMARWQSGEPESAEQREIWAAMNHLFARLDELERRK